MSVVPDFLQKQTQKDLIAVNEMDMMAEAMAKQDKQNDTAGMSMAELFKAKSEKTSKEISDKATGGKATDSEVQDRKARLMAQRDKLRKI